MSLEAADYVYALKKAGWFPLLRADDALTLLIPSNKAMEADPRFSTQTIFQPGHEMALRRALGGTILIGHWDAARIDAALKRHRVKTLALETIDHRFVNVSIDAQSHQPIFVGQSNQNLILWGGETLQTNGVFYLTKNFIDPLSPARPIGRADLKTRH